MRLGKTRALPRCRRGLSGGTGAYPSPIGTSEMRLKIIGKSKNKQGLMNTSDFTVVNAETGEPLHNVESIELSVDTFDMTLKVKVSNFELDFEGEAFVHGSN